MISYVSLDTILPLREAVIIAGTNRDTPYFPGDNAVDTLHVGILEDDVCIGCATLMYSEWESKPAWQLRGMAVAHDKQKKGIGREILRFLDATLPEQAPAQGIWCNARETAVPFYVKNGFTIESDRFIIDNVGPHYKLFKAFSTEDRKNDPTD